jgi:hypothetical protein
MGAKILVYCFKPRHLPRFGRMSQYGFLAESKRQRHVLSWDGHSTGASLLTVIGDVSSTDW